MQVERLKILQQYALDEPNDPFNHYALAQEFLKINLDEAQEKYEYLIKVHPSYLPTYYQFGSLLISLEKFEEAQKVIQKGIQLAKDLADIKANKELNGLLQIVNDELDEW